MTKEKLSNNHHILQSEEIEKIEIELLLEAVFRYYGYDFRNYAFPFIQRRISHRVWKENLSSISALQEMVLRNSEVMGELLSDFSINVTEMFRDPPFFKSFRTKIILKFEFGMLAALPEKRFILCRFSCMKKGFTKKRKYLPPI
jgi:hypothetical protein